MSWTITLPLIVGSFILATLLGLPVAFSFLLVSIGGMFILMGGSAGLEQFVLTLNTSLSNYNFTTIVFYILMGEAIFQSGLAIRAVVAITSLVGRIPGRLAVVTMLGGGLFASLSGSTIANTALFGKLMLPEMDLRGYHPRLSVGSILGSGALAMVIPPSAIAVIFATIAQISIGTMLLSTILPGLLLLTLFISYVLAYSIVRPDHAPGYVVERPEGGIGRLLLVSARDLVPLLILISVVLGGVLLGVASPSESAAVGAAGALILGGANGLLGMQSLRTIFVESAKLATMILAILVGSTAFSQIIAFSGGSRGLVEVVRSTDASPSVVILLILLVGLLLGMFMDQVAIMMIVLPVAMPLVLAHNQDPYWFAVMFLIVLEIGQLTPPVGNSLFTMKAVAPTMGNVTIYRAAAPFVGLNVVAIALIFTFPGIVSLLS